MMKSKFKYKIAFGCWVNDIRNKPTSNKAWPDISIDDDTTKCLLDIINLQADAGYNIFDIFGLLIGKSWPINLKETLAKDRKEKVNYIIESAHDKGIKIIYGLNIYSWGFEKIIKNDIEVQGNSSSAMCGSKSKSLIWQKKIIDFVLSNFNIDGFHLEAFSGGRCNCSSCGMENNIQYFCKINSLVAEYIKKKYPDKLVFINDCACLPWGDYINKVDFKYLFELSENIDVFLDNGCHGLFIREEDRMEFINGLKCDFGTSGGIWVCAPQKWNRLRWFLPYTNKVYKYLRSIHTDGSKACYNYMGPIINPSTEVNTYFGGLAMSDIDRKFDEILREIIEKLYSPKNNSACENLMEIFIKAENAYFDNWKQNINIFSIPKEYLGGLFELYDWSKENYNRIVPGELLLEPLINNYLDIPVYLIIYMDQVGRVKYGKELSNILLDLERIKKSFKSVDKIDRINMCINNVLEDVNKYMDYPVYN